MKFVIVQSCCLYTMVRSLQIFLCMVTLLLMLNIHTTSSHCEEQLKKLEINTQRIIHLETVNRDLQALITDLEKTEGTLHLEKINRDLQARITDLEKTEVSKTEGIIHLETVNRDLQARITDLEKTEVPSVVKNAVACHSFNLEIECEPGYAISVLRANYGRLSRTICTMEGRAPIRSEHCLSERSKTIVDNYCSGRQNCSILAIHTTFGDPCIGTYKYLSVDYQCIPKAPTKNALACHSSNLEMKCEPGYAITVLRANYGRLSQTICNMGGRAPILNQYCLNNNSNTIVDKLCSGKQNCSILATHTIFGDPCVGTYKYLEIEYLCTK